MTLSAARWRDPFVSYAREFALEAKKRVKSQREVVLDQYALDELKLAGLVTGIRPARAMLIDPQRTGHVVHEGQFVGKPEVVHSGTSGAEYEINWRVDRIRENDIVFVREDPANPDVPTATRVIPLRPDEVLAVRGGLAGPQGPVGPVQARRGTYTQVGGETPRPRGSAPAEGGYGANYRQSANDRSTDPAAAGEAEQPRGTTMGDRATRASSAGMGVSDAFESLSTG